MRFYERRGLLAEPPRSKSGYRLYAPDAARRLRFITRAQELGFSLKEVEELLSLRVARHTSSKDIRERVEVKIADIDAKIKTLAAMKRTLRKMSKACTGCGPASECQILESLVGEES